MFLNNLGRLSFLSALLLFFLFILPTGVLAASTLSLSPAAATKAVNDTFSVDIVVDTGGDAIGGVTAMLSYDTSKLQVQGSSITPGSIFGSSIAPFTNTVDATTNPGQIRYDSGTLGTPYTGRGTLATITFRAIALGTAGVNFIFNPSATTGTSLVAAASGPTNLLTSVQNGTYTVASGGTTTVLPATGALENTLIVLGGGLGFLVLGIFLTKKTLLGS